MRARVGGGEMGSKENVKKMVGTLVEKSFPTLRNKKIFLSLYGGGNYSGKSLWLLPFLRILFINQDRRFSIPEMKGLIVHELCHFEIYLEEGWFKILLWELNYWLSLKFRKKEEYKVDKRVITKGYARDLYWQRLSRWDSTDKNHPLKEVYISPEEIKKYAKKIGKW